MKLAFSMLNTLRKAQIIAEIVWRRIAVRRSPLAVTMTAQIERDHVMRRRQIGGDQIESVRVAVKAVQQDQVRSAFAAVVNVVELEAVDVDEFAGAHPISLGFGWGESLAPGAQAVHRQWSCLTALLTK